MARFEFKDPLVLLAEANVEIERLEKRLAAAQELAIRARDVVSPVCGATADVILKAREAAIPALDEALRGFFSGAGVGQSAGRAEPATTLLKVRHYGHQ